MPETSIRVGNKLYERHPLAIAQGHADLDGPIFERMTETLKQHGLITGKDIILAKDGSEWKVLVGWQRLRSCQAAGIKPRLARLPSGFDPETYIEIEDDLRRHEPLATVLERIQTRVQVRRDTVAEHRRQGESLRTIAESVGVSESTVRSDLAKVEEKTGAPVQPEGTDTVKSQDGRERPATAHGTGKGRKKGAGSSGDVVFDDRLMLKAFSTLVGLVDRRGTALHKGFNFDACHNALEAFKLAYDRWKLEST